MKVGDVCIILRNLSVRDGLQNNTRVRITHISKYKIRVQTIEERPRSSTLSRIMFIFKLPFVQSFTIWRFQFPLRLAYSLTMNKSQGQTISGRMLLDLTQPSFTHGHLYVALSRITAFYNIMVFCKEEQVYLTTSQLKIMYSDSCFLLFHKTCKTLYMQKSFTAYMKSNVIYIF